MNEWRVWEHEDNSPVEVRDAEIVRLMVEQGVVVRVERREVGPWTPAYQSQLRNPADALHAELEEQ